MSNSKKIFLPGDLVRLQDNAYSVYKHWRRVKGHILIVTGYAYVPAIGFSGDRAICADLLTLENINNIGIPFEDLVHV